MVTIGALSTCAGILTLPVAIWLWSWEGTAGDGIHPIGAMLWGVCSFGMASIAWGIRGEPSYGRRRCPKCWYDMSWTMRMDSPGAGECLVCPECGYDARRERSLYRSRRRGVLIWFGTALVACGIYGQNVPRALRAGPLGLVPTSVLVAGMSWVPIDWIAGPYAGGADASLYGRSDELRGLVAWRACSLLEHTGDADRARAYTRLLRSDNAEHMIAAIRAGARLLRDPRTAELPETMAFVGSDFFYSSPNRSWGTAERDKEVTPKVVHELIAFLTAGDESTSRFAYSVLTQAGEAGAAAAPEVFAILMGEDHEIDYVTMAMRDLLESSDAGVAMILRPLAKATGAGNERADLWWSYVVNSSGGLADHRQAVVRMLEDSDPEVRYGALSLFWALVAVESQAMSEDERRLLIRLRDDSDTKAGALASQILEMAGG